MSALIWLASIVNAPERMNTLPPGPGLLLLLTSSVEPAVRPTGPKLVTVKAGVLRGLTGTSPAPATLATWIVPAGALIVPPVMATGPPTSPIVPGTGPRVLPLTVIAAGLAVRKPNAAGGAALNVPLALVT